MPRLKLRSERNLLDPISRQNKANKVLTVLADCIATPLSQLNCLEIGCSYGMMTRHFARTFRLVVGIDIDSAAIQFAASENSSRAKFIVADGAHLPFRDESYDVVICTQVYEHSNNPSGMVDEIWRVLREGGVCFFSGPNKLSLVEGHTGLPLVHWLPRSLAKWLVRLLKRGDDFNVNLMTYWQLKRLWHKFIIEDYTPVIMKNPDRFSLRDEIPFAFIASHIPFALYRWLTFAIPNLNWVLTKPKGEI